MESNLTSTRIDPPAGPRAKSKTSTKKEDVIESWEDDDLLSPVDSASGTQTPTEAADTALKPVESLDPVLNPPPPTPISPNDGDQYIDWSPAQVLGGGRPKPYSPPTPSTSISDSDRERRRPEKTTVAAGRMIAAGLGMKTTKRTEEQKQYDRAIREQEIRRKKKEKEEKEREREADEKAKAAIWDS
ncbi:uncharacterized protein Z518_11022 [Rhinocladiella mackenziei CBS 650.93]|uniref:Uncharacterized protein n=1 Tax=Rhinocladiella mackenziei CBS 650.93 TaxID=1442369 RepID=A0A0D2IS94_9EURO|nr:uncharacterized protein Z518_11022 [Rhinocladiella mackenziei CBS 650.93]KIW99609.1 hypothetical protein Z518_11022 [Rhinocladiella mackenziei CBS 650.93]